MQVHTVKDGIVQIDNVVHDLWLLTEQDCDLDQTEEDDVEKIFELRAVRGHAGNIPSGIKGSQVRIDDTRCLNATDIVAKVKASWLTKNKGAKSDIDPDTRREIKTWLGYRYDRPAVPKQFESVHGRIQKLSRSERAIRVEGISEAKWQRLDMAKVRDLLVGYEHPDPMRKIIGYITAIAKKTSDVPELQRWVERIRDAVKEDEVFIIADADAVDTESASLFLLEANFSVYGDAHSIDKASESHEAA